jgi:hypothetical protein
MSKNVKLETYETIILNVVLFWVCDLVFHIEGKTRTEGICEQVAEENIYTDEG